MVLTTPPELSGSGPAVRVWVAEPLVDAELDRVRLSSVDQVRARRFRLEADRRRFVTGRAMVADLMLQLDHRPEDYWLEPRPIVPGVGKPWLVSRLGADLPHLAVAHSGDRVLVTVSESVEVGVDVERLRPDSDQPGVTESVLSPVERREHATVPIVDRPAALLQTFCRKEAVLKAIGLGLAVDPRSLRLTAPGAPPRVLGFDSPYARPVTLLDLDVGLGYCAALAGCGPLGAATVERWPRSVVPGRPAEPTEVTPGRTA